MVNGVPATILLDASGKTIGFSAAMTRPARAAMAKKVLVMKRILIIVCSKVTGLKSVKGVLLCVKGTKKTEKTVVSDSNDDDDEKESGMGRGQSWLKRNGMGQESWRRKCKGETDCNSEHIDPVWDKWRWGLGLGFGVWVVIGIGVGVVVVVVGAE